jgi:hypothetical protein
MKNTLDQGFENHYNANITPSERRFYRPVRLSVTALSGDASFDPGMTVEILRGVDLSLSEEDYVRLMRDAEEGRTARQLREAHPALLEAWDQYRVLLELTRRGSV